MANQANTVKVLTVVMGIAAFGSSTMFTVFVLYCKHVLMLPKALTTHIFAIWLSVYFILHVFAGHFGQRFFGYYLAISAGLLLSCIGENILIIPSLPTFYIGLVIFSVGVSLYSTNIFTSFGELFKVNDTHRSRAFIMIYVIMNIGAFLGDFTSGHLINFLGFKWVFIVASISYLLALIVFVIYGHYLRRNEPNIRYRYLLFVVFCIVSIFIGWYLIMHASSLRLLCIFLLVFCISYLLIKNHKEDRAIRKRAYMLLYFLIFLLSYWAFYMLFPSIVELYIDRHIAVTFIGKKLQPSTIASLSPLFLFAIGMFMARFRKYQDNTLTAIHKISIGLFAITFAFLTLAISTKFFHWPFIFLGLLIVSYFFYALSEILIGPIGYAMVGILVSANLTGMMMGFLTLQRSISGLLTGVLGQLAIHLHSASNIFLLFGSMTFVLAIILLLTKTIRKGLLNER